VALYRQRIEARAKNPLAAEQAEQLLVLATVHLKQLGVYRRRLAHTLEMETYLSPLEDKVPTGCPARLATYVDRSRRGGNPRERDLFDAVFKEMLNAYTRKQMQRIDYR
jgi:hypothetical protein